jgi:hypothetical protein
MQTVKKSLFLLNVLSITGIAYPWHFGTDPDPRIRAYD